MNKIKDWILTHKKTSIVIGIAMVFLIAIGSIVLTFNARQVADSRKQIEIVDTKQKEEALAKKVDEAKKVLDIKIENVDKLSTEDKNKLEAVKKQLSEAIEKKDEQNIVKFQNELKTALNTAKINVEKMIAEEKAKAEEEKKKQEEQKVEETKPTENTIANHSTSQAPASNQTEQQARPQVQTSKPAEESKPAPAPEAKKEEPKPTPAPAKPKERKIIGGSVGNDGRLFKKFEDVVAYAEDIFNDDDKFNTILKKFGNDIRGYGIESVFYNDDTVEYSVNWKRK